MAPWPETPQPPYRRTAAWAIALWIGLTFLVVAAAESPDAPISEDFDHLRTGFPLTGAHERTRCEACHAGGVFEGTPSACGACHLVGASGAVTGKPTDHIPSSNRCEECHVTSTWSDVRFEHVGLTTSCFSCHNDVFAAGKTPDHLPTSNRCDDCHRTVTWSPARFSHVGIGSGCVRCHNNALARGKGPDHIPAPDTCELCHNTSSWNL